MLNGLHLLTNDVKVTYYHKILICPDAQLNIFSPTKHAIYVMVFTLNDAEDVDC